MTAPHVFVSRHLGDPAMARLAEGRLPVLIGPGPQATRPQVLDAVSGAAAAVTLLTDSVDSEFFDSAGPQLQVVANLAVGFDNVDLAEAAARSVIVTNTPDVLTESTADLTMGLLLAVERRIVEADAFLRSGQPWRWEPRWMLGRDLAGLQLGVVGYGRIGQAVARRATAFGMNVVALEGKSAAAAGVATMELDQLLATSDVVSLHCPLTPQTHHLIGGSELRAMKRGAVLINTSRGPLVDEAALVTALSEGRIAGAGLDVYEYEPAVTDGLTALPNTVLTPHLGSAGVQTRDAMALLAADNVLAVLAGKAPLTQVTAT
ncbi:D-glycerate dehydrogenase [Mycobacterium sp. SMC-8]|uniref:2-hydroxyacid dehydrogenase n=1 Tax=Mycobacterium sp. SMC-8 TaxID=2857060 RepID=UPI0021B3CD14|nr:D-glycerate dehydrogenase [Mycobacterium sp. SMC-8]UXA11190.1 D-glycerate dehydrogenase [Mycobacterium sp. SMC-8]